MFGKVVVVKRSLSRFSRFSFYRCFPTHSPDVRLLFASASFLTSQKSYYHPPSACQGLSIFDSRDVPICALNSLFILQFHKYFVPLPHISHSS